MESLVPLRFHHLKAMAMSPAHALVAMNADHDPTRSMEIGSGTDGILLGTQPVICYPGAQRRGKEWEAFERTHQGELILPRGEYDTAMRMAEAVNRHAEATRLLTGTKQRQILFEQCGRSRRSTPDVIGDGHRYVCDLKTARTAKPEWFTRQALRFQYHAQLADQMDGVSSLGQGQPTEAFIVAVESSAPWPVTVLRLTDRALDQGRRAIRLWLEQWLACEADGFFPGYVQSTVDLDIPDDVELSFEDAA